MDFSYALSKEQEMPEARTDRLVLQDMADDLRESAASFAQTSTSTLSDEDILVQQALVLPQLSINNEISQENAETDSVEATNENNSESLVGGLNSFAKRVSLAYTASVSETGESEQTSIDSTAIDQGSVQPVIDADPVCIPTEPLITTASNVKQHIMISYNRSCEDSCRKIRNSLKALKYKVWMDVYDMRDNFIDGMAKAIRNSYIVLMCINRKYDDSYWCKKEAEDIAIKRIKFIPCFMEEPYPLDAWLDFLVGSNVWVDFSKTEKFDEEFQNLINQISFIEDKLATHPRDTPPTTPLANPTVAIIPPSTIEKVDGIMRNFKTWVEDNRADLRRLNRNQSAQLINQLIQGLESDNMTPEDENKRQLLQQLLSSTTPKFHNLTGQLLGDLITLNETIRGLLFIMALWAVGVIFKKN